MSAVLTREKLVNVVISYGCRTTPISAIKPQASRDICSKMQELWADLFEREMPAGTFSELQKQQQGVLFALQKSIYTQVGLAEISTLQIHGDSFTIFIPRRFDRNEVPLYPNDFWLKGTANRDAVAAILALNNLLGNSPHRAGKIYEMLFAPVNEDEKNELFKSLCPNLGERLVEMQGMVTFVRNHKWSDFNMLIQVSAPMIQPVVTVKVDINNRDMRRSLEPSDMQKVYSFADELMPDWFFGLTGETGP